MIREECLGQVIKFNMISLDSSWREGEGGGG